MLLSDIVFMYFLGNFGAWYPWYATGKEKWWACITVWEDQNSTVYTQQGRVQYNQRLEDIRVLKLEIKKLRREKGILQKSVANVDDLRREVYHLQRELLRERTRCKALEEELENPMNIHRWRKLEGSDPSTYVSRNIK